MVGLHPQSIPVSPHATLNPPLPFPRWGYEFACNPRGLNLLTYFLRNFSQISAQQPHKHHIK